MEDKDFTFFMDGQWFRVVNGQAIPIMKRPKPQPPSGA